MIHSLTLSIAGCALRLELSSQALVQRVMRRYHGYVKNTAPSSLRIRCTTTRRPQSGGERVRLTRTDQDGWIARRRDFECCWSRTGGQARVLPSVYSFDALLRVILATTLPPRNGVMVHASALVYKGRGYVFLGTSGSGKTTMTRLLDADRILNDEICAITIDPLRGVVVRGTPFWGELGTGPASPRAYPVDSIYILEKSTTTETVAATPQAALTRLLRCCCVFGSDPRDVEVALGVASRIVASVPVRRLRFEKKKLSWDVLEQPMGERVPVGP